MEKKRTNQLFKKKTKRLKKRWKKREPECGIKRAVHVLACACACACEGEKVRMYNACVVAGKKGGGKSTPSFKKEGKNTAC